MTTSRINTIIDYLMNKISTDPELGTLFADITKQEFPICNEYPALNVNAMDSQDDSSILGSPLKARTVTMRIYVVLHPDGLATDTDMWDTLDTIRTRISADKYLGVEPTNLLINPIVDVNVFTIPSPFGTPLMGARYLEFQCVLREQNI